MNPRITVAAILMLAAICAGSPVRAQQALPANAPAIRSADFCRLLHSVTDRSHQAFGGAVLPGFSPSPQPPPYPVFHAEAAFIGGRSFNLIPQRIIECTAGSHWVMQWHRDVIRGNEAYRGVWGLPNLTNIAITEIYYPDTNSTLVALSFASRQPGGRQVQASTPSSRVTAGHPATPSQSIQYRCADGRSFAFEMVGQNLQLRFEGQPKPVILHPLREVHSPYGNATMRFDFGYGGEVEDSISDLRNGKVVKRTDCYLLKDGELIHMK